MTCTLLCGCCGSDCGTADASLDYAAINAQAAEQYLRPIRPGYEGRNPFWNGFAKKFIYAPAFDFDEVAGAANYRVHRRPARRRDASVVEFHRRLAESRPYAGLGRDSGRSSPPHGRGPRRFGKGARQGRRTRVPPRLSLHGPLYAGGARLPPGRAHGPALHPPDAGDPVLGRAHRTRYELPPQHLPLQDHRRDDPCGGAARTPASRP